MSNAETTEIEACKALQKEEWEVLESIYPEYISNAKPLKLEIPVELESERTIRLVNTNTGLQEEVRLSMLPPLLLNIVLAPMYPLERPPRITGLRATNLWMPHVSSLEQILLEMYQPGQGVLYDWVECIRSGDFLRRVGLVQDGVITISHPAPNILLPHLTSYEVSRKSSAFTQNSYECSICMEYHKGSKCLQLSCGHVFCRSCLEDFWKLCIREGEISRVGCPDPECVKEKREANEEEVARVADADELVRWRWLREKAAMEKDPSLQHCPMTFCQAPVPRTEGEELDEDSNWERLRICQRCGFSFCSFCKRSWHGPVNYCPISASEKIVLEFLALPEGSSGRILIERRYGRAHVRKLIQRYEEEQLNKQWLDSSTTTCPGCEVKVEKSLGCNHMICAKCKMHFCYRCGTKLQASNPYAHFSTPGMSCYYKLFDGETNPDFDIVEEL